MRSVRYAAQVPLVVSLGGLAKSSPAVCLASPLSPPTRPLRFGHDDALCICRYEMLTRGSVTTYSTCDETEGGDASGGNATQGDGNPAGFATQGDGANYSSGGDADGDSERSTAKPSGRAPAGCAAGTT